MLTRSEYLEVLIEFSERALKQSKEAICDDVVDYDDEKLVMMSCMIGTLFEYFDSALLLIKKNRFTALPLIVRQTLEIYTDISNLCSDEGFSYFRRLQFQSKQRAKKALEYNFKNRDSEFTAKENFLDEIKAQSNFLKEEISNLEKIYSRDEKSPLEIKEKFNLIGESDTYNTVYQHLNLQVHNDTSALTSRHTKSYPDQTVIEYFAEPRLNVKLFYIQYLTTLFLDTYQTYKLYLKNDNSIVEQLSQELSELAESIYMDH